MSNEETECICHNKQGEATITHCGDCGKMADEGDGELNDILIRKKAAFMSCMRRHL